MILSSLKKTKGFTLVELMISVGIFALMTALLLARYGTFNQGILLTNLAYDIALTLRTAQSYGLNVKSAPLGEENSFSDRYSNPYGVHFSMSTGANEHKQIFFFEDQNSNKHYEDSEKISRYTLKRGSYVDKVCSGTGNSSDSNFCVTRDDLDITFIRPDPRAIIYGGSSDDQYAEISLKSTDGGSKKVIVRRTGQIAVSN